MIDYKKVMEEYINKMKDKLRFINILILEKEYNNEILKAKREEVVEVITDLSKMFGIKL